MLGQHHPQPANHHSHLPGRHWLLAGRSSSPEHAAQGDTDACCGLQFNFQCPALLDTWRWPLPSKSESIHCALWCCVLAALGDWHCILPATSVAPSRRHPCLVYSSRSVAQMLQGLAACQAPGASHLRLSRTSGCTSMFMPPSLPCHRRRTLSWQPHGRQRRQSA